MAQGRLNFLLFSFLLAILALLARFYYWQIIVGEKLSTIAQKQRLSLTEVNPKRGKIYCADSSPLVLNRPSFLLYAYLPEVSEKITTISEKISPILLEAEMKDASVSAEEKEEIIDNLNDILLEKLSGKNKWVALRKKLGEEEKKRIEQLELSGVGFEEESVRDYPESSMAAHLLGFVGSDKEGQPKGYFGLEGFYQQQLSGNPGLFMEERGVAGKTIFSEKRIKETVIPGLNLTLYLEKPVQFILEDELVKGIEKYGAKSGWGIIIDPSTGGILAMASFPNYDPEKYLQFDQSLFANPVVAEGFEPGSIFKPLIMAAALEEGAVSPETKCDICSRPRKIGEYEIKTWNNQYHPETTMVDVIKNSDNVGMVFVAEKLGKEKILKAIKNYGFGQKTGIDLQEESLLPIRPDNQWYPIDIATLAFGQGILTTPIQIVKAFTALAKEGRIIEPKIVKKIWSNDKVFQESELESGQKIISSKTLDDIKNMMVNAVEAGEAKWAKPENIVIAGKTGTAQIPLAGHYDSEKTIASFIGFAPAEKPKFLMLVSLREPTTSPWGSETAAPIWFKVAKRLTYYWGLYN